MDPATLLRSAGWLALVAMLALSSPGVRVSPDADPVPVASPEASAAR